MPRSGKRSWKGERHVVFRGTRMPVQAVFENLEAGMSPAEITEVFDVTPEKVRTVLHFASKSLRKLPRSAK